MVDELIEPSLTSVAQPFDRIARAAVDLLVEIVRGRGDTPSIRITPDLVPGGSTATR
jgi:DNA-binding LacI/PurR family transcriptional regulator